MASRSSLCRVCQAELPYGGSGRPRTLCDEHRATRPHRKAPEGASRRRLRAVPDITDEPPAPDPAPEPADTRTPVTDGVRDSLAGIDVGHPAGPALRALALRLAGTIDGPYVADPRLLAACSKELRGVLADLAPAKGGEAADDDPFGLASLRPTLVDPQAG